MSLHYIFILIVFLINDTVNVAINDTVNAAINDTVNVAKNATNNNIINSTPIDTADSDSDDMYHLRKLYSAPSAGIFLEGCTNMYSSKNGSDPLKNNERIIKLDNADRLLIMGIFTLQQFSILLYFENPFQYPQNESYVNITLGINRNSAASISGHGTLTQFGNDTVIDDNNIVGDYNGETLPALPYYIAINTSTPNGEVQVTELRLSKQGMQNDPFLKYKYADAGKQLGFQYFRIDHAGPIYAHYSCCELQCTRQTFHRISGCNLHSTRSSSTKHRKTDLEFYYKDVKEKKENKNAFSGVFFIKRPKNTQLAAKFRFYDHKRAGDYYDIVLTDTYTAINQYFKDNTTLNETFPFIQESDTPVTFNITITKEGVVFITRTYESKPYWIHKLKILDREKLSFKHMSMSKLYNDEIRYDFYYNCSSALTYFNETLRFPATIIMNKTVQRFNEQRYDLVRIFNDTFSLDDRYKKYYNEEFHEFEDIDFSDESQSDKDSETKLPSSFIKALTGACSILFIGILKCASNSKFVKYLVQDVVDDEKLKKYRQNLSERFDSGVGTFFGDE